MFVAQAVFDVGHIFVLLVRSLQVRCLCYLAYRHLVHMVAHRARACIVSLSRFICKAAPSNSTSVVILASHDGRAPHNDYSQLDRHTRTVSFVPFHVRSSLAYSFSGAAQGLRNILNITRYLSQIL